MATPDRRSRFGRLTPRELQVLELVARGLSDRAIGAALGIGPGTASTHRARIYATLLVRTPEQAAAVWQEVGCASA